MSWLKGLRARVRAGIYRSDAEREMDEEFRFHLEMEAERLVRAGLSPAEAQRAARVAFGGIEKQKEAMRDGRGLGWLEDLWRDARVAARGLRRSPVLVIGAVVSLGLAIGLNTAVFSFGNWLLLKSLPVPAGKDLVHIEISKSEPGPGRASYPDYLGYRTHARTLSGLAAHTMVPTTVRLPGSASVATFVGAVSGNFFEVLGLKPATGRFFLPNEDRTPGADPVAVVSHHYWQYEMGGDPGAVGRTVILNRKPFTIVGVAPQGFAGTSRAPVAFDVFVPMMMRGALSRNGQNLNLGRDGSWGQLLGRMRPGATPVQVQAELDGIARGLAQSHPETSAGMDVKVVPARGAGPELKRSGVPLLLYLVGAVVIALLVACANVAGLLLARAAARRREVAIRLSLGASRLALVRPLLIEGLLLALPAGVLGYLLAPWGTKAVQGFLVGPPDTAIRANMDLSPDGRVLAFTLALSLGSVFLFGLVPALQATRLDLLRSLRGEAPAGRRQGRLGGAVVVAQVAFSVMLLFSAGVLVRGMLSSLRVDPGFRAEQVVAAPISPEGPAYEDPARKNAFFAELVHRLEVRPEIGAAGLASAALLGFGAPDVAVRLPGEEPVKEGSERRVPFNAVTPGVLELLGVPLLRGRTLQLQDSEGAPLVAVVNETLARRLWPGHDAIGERFQVEGQVFEVVGVVADAKYIGTEEQQSPYIFLSYAQNRERVWSTNVYASVSRGEPAAAISIIRHTVHALDPDVPVGGKTLAANLRYVLQPTRAIGTLIGTGAVLALVLAAIGTYALLSYAVVRRTREIGVRVALGARAADVRRLIVREGLGLAMIGTLIGLPLGWVGARALRALIQGISPADPLSLGAVTVVLLAVAATASWLPAWRAARMNPIEALRVE